MPRINVEMNPPINPSNVLFGDSEISWVLPKSFPKTYANMSLVTTKRQGITNL
jgi:hypothetical protein